MRFTVATFWSAPQSLRRRRPAPHHTPRPAAPERAPRPAPVTPAPAAPPLRKAA